MAAGAIGTSTYNFADLLRRYRVNAGLSQEALAARAGLSVSGIAALERGRRTAPRPDTVALLADALTLDAESGPRSSPPPRRRRPCLPPRTRASARPHPRSLPLPLRSLAASMRRRR